MELLRTHPEGAHVGPAPGEPLVRRARRVRGRMSAPELEIPHQLGRGLLSTMRSLLVLGQLMTESTGERQILDLAMTAVPSLARCRVVGIEQAGGATRSTATVGLGRQLRRSVPTGGAVTLQASPGPGRTRSAARCGTTATSSSPRTPSRTRRGAVPAAGPRPADRVGAGQPPAARPGARDRRRARAWSTSACAAPWRRCSAAWRSTPGSPRSLVSDEGRDGIARAVHELTGLPVAIEDRYGNLRAWAGPNRPDPYPKDPAPRREALLRRARRPRGRPIREGGTLVALAHPQGDVLGVICLVDPGGTAGEHEVMALEHGATILAMELARVRSLAESELRIRRDLVDELLTGTDEESALARATALGLRPAATAPGRRRRGPRPRQGQRRALPGGPARGPGGAGGHAARGAGRAGGPSRRPRGGLGEPAAERHPRPRRRYRADHRRRAVLGRRGLPAVLPAGPARDAPAPDRGVGRPGRPLRRPRRLPAAHRQREPGRGRALRRSAGSARCSPTTPSAAPTSSARSRTTSTAAGTTRRPRPRSSCTATP